MTNLDKSDHTGHSALFLLVWNGLLTMYVNEIFKWDFVFDKLAVLPISLNGTSEVNALFTTNCAQPVESKNWFVRRINETKTGLGQPIFEELIKNRI